MSKDGVKESCNKCSYWTGIGGIGKAYKCYFGDCPAKARDDKSKAEVKSPQDKRYVLVEKQTGKFFNSVLYKTIKAAEKGGSEKRYYNEFGKEITYNTWCSSFSAKQFGRIEWHFDSKKYWVMVVKGKTEHE